MDDHEMIKNIKYVVKKSGIAYCYGMPVPNNVTFYKIGGVLLTNSEMDHYFYKYRKWQDYFKIYEMMMPNFYIIDDSNKYYKEIENFLICKYNEKKLQELLGKNIIPH